MFVYCNDCNWQQDDFWSESYYPTSNHSVIDDVLLPGILDKDKRQILMEAGEADAIGLPYDPEIRNTNTKEVMVDFRAVVGMSLMNTAKRVMNMFWVTFEDFNADLNKQCPICNSTDLGID